MGNSRKMESDELLAFIRSYTVEHRYPPSRREIADHFGVYPNAVNDRLRRLIDEGLIQVTPGISRSVNVTGAGMKMITETL